MTHLLLTAIPVRCTWVYVTQDKHHLVPQNEQHSYITVQASSTLQ